MKTFAVMFKLLYCQVVGERLDKKKAVGIARPGKYLRLESAELRFPAQGK